MFVSHLFLIVYKLESAYRSLIELFLPEGILAYFELVGGGKDAEGFKISLEEKNIPPEEYLLCTHKFL